MNGGANPEQSDREIVVARTIEAPRSLLFEVYSDVKHLAEWWGPSGFTTTTHSFEFRVGGEWDFIMHGPDGVDYPNWIRWLEIVPPERIQYLHAESADDPNPFESIVTFVDRGNSTEVIIRALFKTKEQRDDTVERFGALEGGRQHLGRLADYVGEMGNSKRP